MSNGHPGPVASANAATKLNPRRWSVWSLPRSVLTYIVLVEIAAVVAIASTARLAPITPRALAWCGLLLLGVIIHKETARGIDRIREIATEGSPHTNLQSIWFIAALLLLPPPLVALVVVFSFMYAWARVYQRRPPLHRKVFSAATVVLSCWPAGVVLALAAGKRYDPSTPPISTLTGINGLAILIAAGLLYWLINYALVVAVIIMTNPNGAAMKALGHPTEQLLIWAGVGLGTAVALVMTTRPWLLPLLMLTVLALHMGLLLPQFQKAARTDAKTGLAESMFWHRMAAKELARAEATHATLGILVIDLDHFKQINDRYGHLPGDDVLRAVAKAIKAAVRNYDLVGRLGGEEFAVLLPGATYNTIFPTAERLRLAVSQVSVAVEALDSTTVIVDKLTASVGAAVYPDTATDLTALIMSADAALYQAKEHGRDQTQIAPSVEIPTQS